MCYNEDPMYGYSVLHTLIFGLWYKLLLKANIMYGFQKCLPREVVQYYEQVPASSLFAMAN